MNQYRIEGDNKVTTARFVENYELIFGDEIILTDPMYPLGRVYINDRQFFQQVPKAGLGFYNKRLSTR